MTDTPLNTGASAAGERESQIAEILGLIRRAHDACNIITVQRAKIGPLATQAQTAGHALALAASKVASLSSASHSAAGEGKYRSAADCPLGSMHGNASTHGSADGEDLCDFCGFPADDRPAALSGQSADGAAMREAAAKVAEDWGQTDFSTLGETIAREIRALPLPTDARAVPDEMLADARRAVADMPIFARVRDDVLAGKYDGWGIMQATIDARAALSSGEGEKRGG